MDQYRSTRKGVDGMVGLGAGGKGRQTLVGDIRG